MSEDFVRSELKEHLHESMPNLKDPWPAIRNRIQAHETERRPWWTWAGAISLRPMAGAIALALVVALVVAGTSLFVAPPRTVSAEEILANAEKMSKNGVAAGLSSGHIVTVFRNRTQDPGKDRSATNEVIEGRSETWYEAPDKLFHKSISRMPDGSELQGINLEVGDTMYATLPGHEEIRIMERREGATRTFSPVNAEQLLSPPRGMGPVEKPYTVTLLGNEQVAGRAAYLLEWNVTPEALEAEAAGGFWLVRHKYRMWIDQQFYLVLKLEAWDKDGVLIDESSVESLELDRPVDSALFVFKPPAGYVVADMRPANANEVEQGWREAARQVNVTLYGPSNTNAIFAELRRPYFVASQGTVTQAVVRELSRGEVLHALVVQGPTSGIDESRLGKSTPVRVGAWQGRLYKRNEAHYLVFDIGSTRVMLYSSNMGEGSGVADDLVAIGESLSAVGKK
jgi:MucB/RseB N-terminal domain